MKIAILSASARRGSNSLKVSKQIQKQLLGDHEVRLFSFEGYDLPFVGQADIDKNALTVFQQGLVDTWAFGELVFIVAPEYNWSTSPELINAIDQLGDDDFAERLFGNKVFALAGVSSGRGGRQPVLQLQMMVNKMINFLNQYAIVSPRVFESHETSKNVDENGNSLNNPHYDKGLKAFVDYSLTIAKKWF